MTALPPPGTEQVLYLVDLSGYVYRAYHAIAPLSNGKGEPTHAVMGTVNMLQRVIAGRKPTLFAVAMDSRTKSFRKEIDPRYKATRPPAPDDLKSQMRRCEEMVKAYNIPVYQKDGLEADDLIASLVRRARSAGVKVVIVSADKDLMQLIADDSDDVLMWDSMRDKVYSAKEVQEKFGVPPSKLRDLLALTGDTSDNVPGVPGVGPKTAAELLRDFESVEGIYSNLSQIKKVKLREKLEANEAEARLSQRLVTLRSDEDVPWDPSHLRYGGADTEALRALFTELEFTRLLDALPKGASTPSQPVPKVGRAKSEHRTTGAVEVAWALEALTKWLKARDTSGLLSLVLVTAGTNRVQPDVVGIALATDGMPVLYLAMGHRYLGAPQKLAWEEVARILLPALARQEMSAHDAKLLYAAFAHAKQNFTMPVFDTMLASYLLDPDADHSLPAISERGGLGKSPPLAGMFGEKTKETPFDEQDVQEAGAAAAKWAQNVLLATGPLSDALSGQGLLDLAFNVEFPLTHVLSTVEREGVLVDFDHLARVSDRIGVTLRELEAKAKTIVGHEFSIRSRDQLEKILFDDLGLRVVKRTPKGGRSTDAEVLAELADEHELPKVIWEYRELDKLKGTYLDALPRYRNVATGRIHTRFEQTVAATGRLSSIDPNLQNIPIRGTFGPEIRGAFIAPKGHVILSADYSQVELRVLAHLSQDPELLRAFNQEEDVHTLTASIIFEVDRDKVTQDMRRKAKTVNFGVIYGMGETALAKQLSIPKEQAAGFIRTYFERYAGVRKFMEGAIEAARKGDAVRTLLGRRRFLPNLHSSNRGLRMEAERIAKNTPIQGTAADILKLAMLALGQKPVTPSARMILTVHDELVFEVEKAEAETASELIRAGMMNAAALSVPLVVDVGFGDSWATAHS